MASRTSPMRSSMPRGTSSSMDSASNARVGQQQSRGSSVQTQQQQQQQLRTSTRGGIGNVAILWDIENCPVPGEVNTEDVAGNIRYALRDHPQIGAVTMFSAYGDFNHFPRKVREGCQRTGVNLIDVPNGKKNAADKAILVDMFLFALDNCPPSTIFLITGEVDFAPALHKLGQRGYMVVLVVPDGVGVSSALCAAGNYVWDWPSLCRGDLIYPQKYVQNRVVNNAHEFEDRNSAQFGTTRAQSQQVPRLVQESSCLHHIPVPAPPSSKGQSRPLFPNPELAGQIGMLPGEVGTVGDATSEPTSPGGVFQTTWVMPPRDMSGLKRQIVKLLSLNGGKMALVRVPAEYNKQFGRPLCLADYNASKLVNLIEKMKDSLCIKGEGGQKILHLTKSSLRASHKYRTSSNRASVPKSEKEKVTQLSISLEEKFQKHICQITKQGLSVEMQVEKVEDLLDDVKLATFRDELQQLLVSWTWHIRLAEFLQLYKQRYTHDIDLKAFGVENLESLLQKVKDVAVIKEDPATRDAFLVGVNAKNLI
ncbi:unnamed protein product [Sphagnum troendelagicum]|uniref:HTH OST-type domain-containing protein n=1 Tax=Sphagnum troendelagicum TaxID=128251 RepID=A0ABP0TFB6_9BRYO